MRALDSPAFGRRLYAVLVVICALVGLADLLYTKQIHFAWEAWIGFFGGYGFVCCVFLVLAAKAMRRVVRRDRDYYDG